MQVQNEISRTIIDSSEWRRAMTEIFESHNNNSSAGYGGGEGRQREGRLRIRNIWIANYFHIGLIIILRSCAKCSACMSDACFSSSKLRSLRRKDLVIYELPGLFRVASRNPADEGPLAAAFNCKLSVANGKFSRYPQLVICSATRGVFFARHQGRGSRIGWRKATIINAALGSRK
jgi:hypothetical protein